MNNVFTAKLLQNLSNKKGNKGFTLIELLVVVIIIGVLAAVALPNLLGQVAKGRQAEAKNNLGAINRSQQATRLEDSVFGVIEQGNFIPSVPDNPATPAVDEGRPGVPLLPVGITGDNYTYADMYFATTNDGDAVSGGQRATPIVAFENDIRDYTSAVGQQDDGVYFAVICENIDVDGNGTLAPDPTPGTATSLPVCDPTTTKQL
ncbi:MAG: prepilin-type N-terminal cleavage/methylation domain-containing protein [Cyanobacteria bacterium P01_G01_bin.67]